MLDLFLLRWEQQTAGLQRLKFPEVYYLIPNKKLLSYYYPASWIFSSNIFGQLHTYLVVQNQQWKHPNNA